MPGNDPWNIICGKTPLVMAIINVTPDSFYDGSRTYSTDEAVNRAEHALTEGADILDIGGYSSRPGANDISVQEELSRVLPAVESIREKFPEAVLSIDTFRSEVAAKAIEAAGACIINDISAGTLDPDIISLAAQYDAPYIAMHIRGTPADMAQNADYNDVVREVKEYFIGKIARLCDAGLRKIIIDPGLGFAKELRHNYELLANLDSLSVLGAPLLVGLSRKSMVWKVTGGGPEDALPGTSALHWAALEGGAHILRVHDVKAAADVIKLYEYYTGYGLKRYDDTGQGPA